MSTAFCTTCGQRRDGDARFCKKCGTEFREGTLAGLPADERTPTGPTGPVGPPRPAPPVPPPDTAWPPRDTAWPPPDTVWPPRDTAWPPPDTVWPPPADTAPPAPRDTPWLPPADTLPPPARPPVPPPVPPVPPPVPPAGPYAGQRSPARGRKTLVIAAGVVVVLLAAGGGAYALVQPGKSKPVPGSSRSGPTGNVVVATTTPPTPSASPTPSATATPSPTPSASPTQPGPVTVAAGVTAGSARSRVVAFLDRYFTAINKRDYGAYDSLLDPTEQQSDSRSSFESGYATTTDSAEQLTGLRTSGGDTAATVSFTSHQDAADSVNGSTCTDWTITLFLVPAGNSYEITAPPSSYRSSYADCTAG